MQTTTRSVVKLIYVIIALNILVFLSQPAILMAVALLQSGLWVISRLPLSALFASFRRLSIFFIIILIAYSFFNVGAAPAVLDLGIIQIEYNESGAQQAVLMCLRVFLMVWASVWLQRSENPGAMAATLRKIGLPELLATAIDSTLFLLTGSSKKGSKDDAKAVGQGGGGGTGKGKGKKHKIKITFQQIRQGDLSFITDRFHKAIDKAKHHLAQRYPDLTDHKLHDLTIIVGISAAIMGLKLIQLFPGLPVAPGHKNIIIIPFFLAAAALTHFRLGGLMTGLTVGIVSVMMGFGKFGLFEISHFAVPGLLADILFPFVALQAPRWVRIIQLSLIGMIMGFGRFTANFLVILLAGAPEGAFILYLPMLFTQILFGGLSVFVSLVILQVAMPKK